jgi:hypothetical protein
MMYFNHRGRWASTISVAREISYAYVAEQNRESGRRDILGKAEKIGSGLFVFMGRNSLKRHDPKK